MQPVVVRIDVYRLHKACDKIDTRSTVLIAIGVFGILFGLFWVGLALTVGALRVAPLWQALVMAFFGLGPVGGAGSLFGYGVFLRSKSSLLRQLGPLSYGRSALRAEDILFLADGRVDGAARLLGRAVEIGAAEPVALGAAVGPGPCPPR